MVLLRSRNAKLNLILILDSYILSGGGAEVK